MMIMKYKLISIGSLIYPLDHFFYLYQIKTGQKLSRMRHIWPVDRQLLNTQIHPMDRSCPLDR
jgi:hypothetical protein